MAGLCDYREYLRCFDLLWAGKFCRSGASRTSGSFSPRYYFLFDKTQHTLKLSDCLPVNGGTSGKVTCYIAFKFSVVLDTCVVCRGPARIEEDEGADSFCLIQPHASARGTSMEPN